MSAPIGPGDWVECIQNRLATTLPPIGLVVGRVYRVTATGETDAMDAEPHTPWVRISGVRLRADKDGFRASWFRPVYRAASDLIQSLKQPAPERELEDA